LAYLLPLFEFDPDKNGRGAEQCGFQDGTEKGKKQGNSQVDE
jgi:hypothetical protein